MKKIFLYLSFLFLFCSFVLADSFYQTKQSTTTLANSFVLKSSDTMTGQLTVPNLIVNYGIITSTGLVGSDANFIDFPNASLISSKGNSGHSYTNNVGIVGESLSAIGYPGIGVGGVSKSNGIFPAYGIAGRALVDASASSGAAIGVHGLSEATHIGGSNIGVQSNAIGGLLNYSFYGTNGDIYNTNNIQTSQGIIASTGVFTSTVTVRLINADATNGISITASSTTFNGDIVVNTNGTSALISTNKGSSGSNNLYIGNGGQLTTSAFANSTFGISAGNKLTSGQQNTYIGWLCGSNSQASIGNTGVGYNSLLACVGSNSTAVGVNALKSLTTSTRNVALGGEAGAWQVAGNNNTFIGYGSGQYIYDGVTKSTSMVNSVLIGYDSRVSTITSDNEIVIGASATGNGSNTATFGNNNITDTYLKGRVIINKNNSPITTTQVLYSTNTISAASSNAVVVSSGGAVSLTTAQITAGTVGDEIEIWGSSDTNTITLVDGGILKLNDNVSFTLGVDDVIKFRYMSSGYWCELSRSNN